MDYSTEKLEQLKGLNDNHESKNLLGYTYRERFLPLSANTHFQIAANPTLNQNYLQ
jgi:hypothetical protein